MIVERAVSCVAAFSCIACRILAGVRCAVGRDGVRSASGAVGHGRICAFSVVAARDLAGVRRAAFDLAVVVDGARLACLAGGLRFVGGGADAFAGATWALAGDLLAGVQLEIGAI